MALARTHQQAKTILRRQAPCVTQARQLHLTPREADHLQLHQVGALAQKRLARGLRLNQPEAVGLHLHGHARENKRRRRRGRAHADRTTVTG